MECRTNIILQWEGLIMNYNVEVKTSLKKGMLNPEASTIEKALSSLVKNQRIQLITKGRYSKYFRL